VNAKWLATGVVLAWSITACDDGTSVDDTSASDGRKAPDGSDESSATGDPVFSDERSDAGRDAGRVRAAGSVDAGRDARPGERPAAAPDAQPDGKSDAGGAVLAGDASAPSATCEANTQNNPTGADPCTAPLRPSEDRKCEFMYNGQKRKFYIYAPPSYNACEPAAMVVDSHGASESAEVHIGQARFAMGSPLGYGSSWRRAVQGDNAIIVTPEGVGLRWSKAEDPAFLNKVADMVEAVAKVDPEKRYLTGISMGGMVTVETGCKDSKRWRGMVPVAMLTNTCASIERPTPALIYHSETDSITSYADSRKLAEKLVQLNKCQGAPTKKSFGGANSAPDPVCFEMPYKAGSPDAKEPYAVPITACPKERPESVCELWSQCDPGAQVMFCTVKASTQQYGGHLLYTNDTGLHLAALAWPFLKQFWK
jgi:poly(3-hydroxybutyrate) depolymerase